MIHVNLVSFVLRSKTRKRILELLLGEQLTPSQIKKRTEMYESHVSRALKELLEKSLIKCENPEERRFKFYKITSLGKNVLNEANKISKEIGS